MKRLDRVREAARRAYGASRDSFRVARQRVERPPVDNGELLVAGPVPAAGEPVPAGPVPPPEPGPAPIDEAVPRSLRIGAAWSWRLILIAAVAYGLLWITDRYIILFAPLMIGLLLAGLLAPALRWLLKLRLNRSLATLVVLIGGLGVVGGTLTLVVNQVIAGLDDMQRSAVQGFEDIQEWLQDGPLNMSQADLDDLIQQGQTWVQENTQELTAAGLTAVTGTVQFLTGFVLGLVFTFFFLRDGRRIWTFLVSLLPVRARAPMAYAGEGAWRTLTGYVRATVLVAFIDAVGIGVGLWLLDVPLEVPLAALVFLGAFVPIIGAFVSGTVAVLVALVDAPVPGSVFEGGGIIKALMVLGLIILVQQIEGNILQPIIMSRAVKIHPLAVIIAVTAGILLAGIIGALVAVPVVAVLNTVIRRLNHHYLYIQQPPDLAIAAAGPEPSTTPSEPAGPAGAPPAPAPPAPAPPAPAAPTPGTGAGPSRPGAP